MSTQGSISRSDSGWMFVVDVPSADGRRKQLRQRGFRTKREAQEALTAALGDVQRGMFVAPNRVTLADYLLTEWLPARREALRPSTANGYEQLIRCYVVSSIGSVKLRDLDGSTLNRFYSQLLTKGRTESRRATGAGLSPKTVRNVHGVLKRAFRDGVRWGRLQRNPCDAADPPRGQSPEMKAWTADDLRQFTRSVAAPMGWHLGADDDDGAAAR